ncbi:CheR family methyltransferase [Oricola thermophila]|uniref:Chemotaxis protein methyltransferase n=1 Tax=Oricola thermophila TaxID=2742145 RepID=A0A6N1VFP9_9HYPH|nr:protein-glutamate O-methyltransferase [Oricola thermophila]QKV19608.1 protein-glutamate O-methyltransferase [Oricola thermophila]
MNLAVQQMVERPEGAREFLLTDKHFATIAKLVREEAGINLTEAKRDLVYSRLVKRLRRHALTDFGTYLDLVSSPAGEMERRELISAITTNVTNFYREPHHFEHLERAVMPELAARMMKGEPVRMWSAGCSDGREPYTMACTVLKAFPEVARYNFRILASDIDHNSLAKAKEGRYSNEMVDKAPAAIRERYFRRLGDVSEPVQQVRDLIAFRYLNLLHEWPFKQKFDVIFCRNVLIYFDQELQSRLFTRFCSVLKPGGYLYIGHSERIAGPATSALRQVAVTSYKHITGGIR